jgi:hypothetical protein
LTPQATGLSAISLSLDERGRKMLDMINSATLLILALLVAHNAHRRWMLEDQVEGLRDSINYLERRLSGDGRR